MSSSTSITSPSLHLRRRPGLTQQLCLAGLALLCAPWAAAVEEPLPGTNVDELLQEYRLVDRVVRLIQREYVRPVDRRELWRGAIAGMVQTLDPHSRMLSPRELLRRATDALDDGFGFSWHYDEAWQAFRIVRVLPGGPAELAGMVRGDSLLSVDEHTLEGVTVQQAEQRMAALGDHVTIRLRRADGSQTQVTLERTALDGSGVSVAGFVEPDHGVALVRVDRFVEIPLEPDGPPSTRTASVLRAALSRLHDEGMRGLILDLRGNPGGSLQAAVEVADLFLEPSPSEGALIVAQIGRSPAHQARHVASPLTTLPEWPVVVLIDEASASSAEIVAAALREHGRAVLVGQTTAGKQSVQQRFLVGDQGALLLTVASFRTPSGRNLAGTGLPPDVPVILDDQTRLELAARPEAERPLHDPQVQRARDILIGAMLLGRTPGLR